ncbi:MAG: hypothetical protein EB034_24265, partial [Verrucomicrobia bacterium]|nr:hypothetical protein [Verrucomicrobiota bacterium]
MSINLPAPVMTTPFQPKLGFDNYALRSLGWKARQILIHAAKLKLDAVLFSDFDVYESLADDHLRDLKLRADDLGLTVYAGMLSICPSSVIFDGVQAATEVIKDNLSRDIGPVGHDFITLGERMRDRGFKKGLVDEVRVFERELSSLEMLASFDRSKADALFSKTASGLSSADRATLEEYFLKTQCAEYTEGLARLKTARTELVALLDAQREIMVMQELPSPKKAFVLFRGQY